MAQSKISSLQHDIVKHAVRLRKERSERYASQQILLLGSKIVGEHAHVHTLFSLSEDGPTADNRYIVTDSILEKIAAFPTDMAAIVSMPKPSSPDGNRILALDGIQDPGNLGTLFRTATALGFSHMLLLPTTCDPFNEKAIQSGRGTQLTMPYSFSTAEDMLLLPHTKYAAEMNGMSIHDIIPDKQLLLVMGNEGHGVTDSIRKAATPVTIPIHQTDSLNVAVAAGILMHHLRGANV